MNIEVVTISITDHDNNVQKELTLKLINGSK